MVRAIRTLCGRTTPADARRRAGTAWPAAALALALLTVGCTVVPDNRETSLPEIKQAQPAPPPVSAADREHDRILAAYGGAYQDPKLETLITRTVERLVAASDRPDLHYRVTLLNSGAVNAFALPTGRLYVTRGLAALADDDSELASVLAHEMSHVIAHHAAIRAEHARQTALVSNVVNELLSDPQSGARALAKSKLALASFSRAQEYEADAMGVGISARAGFDPYGASRFLTAMGRNAALKGQTTAEGETGPIEFLASHPATPDRVRAAIAQARRYSAPGAGKRDKADYLAALDGVVYGDDPSEGYVRGRRFLHAKLGFTFVAPEGFSLDNTAQAVLGVKNGGNQALRLDVVRVPAEQSLADYLASGWIENVDKRSIADIRISGFPAATASAKGEQWSFRLYAIRFGSEVYRFIFAAKRMTPQIDRGFHHSVESFRRLTLDEMKTAKPLRIRLVTVKPGDTVAKLSRAMIGGERAAERFRVLNGLAENQEPKPGDLVKIVAE